MKTKLAILGGLAIVGAGVWYFFIKNRNNQGWQEEEQEPVGPIHGHDESEKFGHTKSHLREVMHTAKELAL